MIFLCLVILYIYINAIQLFEDNKYSSNIVLFFFCRCVSHSIGLYPIYWRVHPEMSTATFQMCSSNTTKYIIYNHIMYGVCHERLAKESGNTWPNSSAQPPPVPTLIGIYNLPDHCFKFVIRSKCKLQLHFTTCQCYILYMCRMCVYAINAFHLVNAIETTHSHTNIRERKKKKTTTSKVLNTVQMIDLLPTFGMHLFVITANISFVSRSYVVALPTRILFEHNQCELHTTYYILYLCIPYYYIMRVKFMFDEDIYIWCLFSTPFIVLRE